MNLNDIQRIYFIGIGGIGMSALARFFIQRGCVVTGYDRTRTPLTELLEQEGMKIHYTEDLSRVDASAQLVVFTPAIPSQHIELVWYKQNGYPVVKRSDVLQIISNDMQAVCVAGTHGKTTISTMIAHILRHTGYGCNAFLGGISANYGVNYWSSSRDCAVIEADEYDKSFLKLNPSLAVVSAMDADHLDIYGTVEEMERCYLEFVSKVRDTLIYKHGLKHQSLLKAPHKYSYSLQNDAADFYADSIRMKDGAYSYSFCKQGEVLAEVALNVGGMHNIENSIAAMAICLMLDIQLPNIVEAMAAYQGVHRRFEYVLKTDRHILIDDYAHHPEELAMLLKSARALFPQRKLSVVFQPHLYTRTRDFADGFAESLDMADEVILLEIYPARELPIEGISSELIRQKMGVAQVHLLGKEGMQQWVETVRPELLVMAGAGDIDQLVKPVKDILSK